MLTNGERNLAIGIFIILFILSAAMTIGQFVLIGISIVFLVQALILYFRIAKEEWTFTPGLTAQFENSQRLYRQYLLQMLRPSVQNADQEFLDAYGGRRTIREWILEIGKRLLKAVMFLIAWLPAAAIHIIALGFAGLFHLAD